MLPQRYIQWMVTTPTLVYVLSKISDFTTRSTALTITADVLMIIFGLVANFGPRPFQCECVVGRFLWCVHCVLCAVTVVAAARYKACTLAQTPGPAPVTLSQPAHVHAGI